MKGKTRMEQKFKIYNPDYGFTDSMTLKEIAESKIHLAENDKFVQFLGYQDADKRDVYEYDVLELPITKEFLESRWFSENKFFQKNKDKITSLVIEHKPSKTSGTRCFIYPKIENEFVYSRTQQVIYLTEVNDILLSDILARYGAAYIGNTLENPYLIQQPIKFKKNVTFVFEYKNDKSVYAVIENKNDKIMIQSLTTHNVYEVPVSKISNDIDKTDLVYPLSLRTFLYTVSHSNCLETHYSSLQDAIDFYNKNYDFTDEDEKYLQSIDISELNNEIELE